MPELPDVGRRRGGPASARYVDARRLGRLFVAARAARKDAAR